MTAIVERAANSSTPKFAKKFGIDSDAALLLLRLCRELQRDAGERPFFLSARKAAEVCNIDAMTAWRYLKGLAGFGVIEAVSVGSNKNRKASEWRYLRPLEE